MFFEFVIIISFYLKKKKKPTMKENRFCQKICTSWSYVHFMMWLMCSRDQQIQIISYFSNSNLLCIMAVSHVCVFPFYLNNHNENMSSWNYLSWDLMLDSIQGSIPASSKCWSIHEQDTQPLSAPDMQIGAFRGWLCYWCMNVCVNG